MDSTNVMIISIQQAVASGDPISRDDVKTWIQSSDIEVLGALWDLIVSEELVVRRVEPHLGWEEAESFVLNYFKRCLKENPQGEWSDSRFSAAWSIAGWFKSLPEDDKTLVGSAENVKNLLAQTYLEGDPDIRNAVVTGTLEHILEEPRWRSFFMDWLDHPVLNQAYNEAMDWALWFNEHENPYEK